MILELIGWLNKVLDIEEDGINDGLVPLKTCLKQHDDAWGHSTEQKFFISKANHESDIFCFTHA